MRVVVGIVAVMMALLPGCRVLSGEIACENDRQCSPGDTCIDNSCVAPCDDLENDRCDTDGDGVNNGADVEADNACIPDAESPRCAAGDLDGDESENGVDPAPRAASTVTSAASRCTAPAHRPTSAPPAPRSSRRER